MKKRVTISFASPSEQLQLLASTHERTSALRAKTENVRGSIVEVPSKGLKQSSKATSLLPKLLLLIIVVFVVHSTEQAEHNIQHRPTELGGLLIISGVKASEDSSCPRSRSFRRACNSHFAASDARIRAVEAW